MYLAIDTLRNSQAFKLSRHQPATSINIAMPHIPAADDGKPFKFKACRNYYKHHYNKVDGVLKGFMAMLAKVPFTVVSIGQVGHTWLELYLLSLGFAPNLAELLYNRTARASRCIGAQISSFKKGVQQLLPLILDEQTVRLFQAAKSTRNRLATYGMSNRIQHTK
eukprot:11546406-Karenia_brevis.AAC.1